VGDSAGDDGQVKLEATGQVRNHGHILTSACITAIGTEPQTARAHDLQGQAELDLRMEAHSHLVGAEGLDGFVNDEPTPVELESGLTANCVDDVRGGDGAEQPAFASGSCLDTKHDRDELAGDRLGTFTVARIFQVA
jgi:hypothetical protein